MIYPTCLTSVDNLSMFQDETIKDLIYKGYTIVYKIDAIKAIITIIGMKKYQNEL